MNSSVNCSEEKKFLDFKDSNFFAESFSVMDELREQRKLCDVILKVEDKSFSVHRNILASVSPYFLAMFTNDNFPESQMKEITMKEIEPSALEKLIDFAYRGKVRIDSENVRSLIGGASLLLLDSVRDACVEFLVSQLNPANVLGIRNFADLMDCTYLFTAANEYIHQNFSKVAISEDFLDLDLQIVLQIIERDDLEVDSEEAIYEASMRWVKANQEERVPLLPKVLSKVRLPLLSPQFLVGRVLKEDMIRMSLQSRDLVDEAIVFHLLPEPKGDLESSRARHRGSRNREGKIYAVGGYSGNDVSVKSVEIYDPVTNKWQMGKEMLAERGFHGVAVSLGKLFAFGGENTREVQPTIDVFDPKTNKWSQSQCMMSRSGAGFAVLNNLIYVCGGSDGAMHLNTVECFCPTTDTWRTVAPMIKRRSGGAAATLGGYIYAAGGEPNRLSTDPYWNLVEKYDPAKNTWVEVKPMIERRTDFGLASLGGKLYACGGANEDGYLESAEVFDPVKGAWKMISPMNCTRGSFALVGNMGKLWAIGGFDGESSVEVYDPVTDKWSFVASMSVPRRGIAAATIAN